MEILEAVKMGLNQLRVHKLRALLSILGILISVGSVTGIVSMGDGLKKSITDQFNKMGGPSLVLVRPPDTWYRNSSNQWVRRDWEEHLTIRDLERLAIIENVRFVVPRVNYGSAETKYRKAVTSATAVGSNEYYLEMQNWKLKSGRFINNNDVTSAAKVTVIGQELAEELFGDEDPVGKEVKGGDMRLTVIGVLDEVKNFGNSSSRRAVVPFTTVQSRVSGNNDINFLYIMADSPENADAVAVRIRRMLRQHHVHGDEFQVTTGESEIAQFNRIVLILKLVAGGIAGISLLVGGIGIMNIMLVSVSERTREIGIRKALGATRRKVLLQFLVEAMTLCLVGGILGIILGMLLGAGIATYIRTLTSEPFVSTVTPGLMFFAILYSSIIGLFFGVYPAYRASRLDPIEALRYE